jgi:hypothetical protein
MRFYVPLHILAADYSHVLQGRGVTLDIIGFNQS